jgi:hypothetical protein
LNVGARVGAANVLVVVGAPKPPNDVKVGARVVLVKEVGDRNDVGARVVLANEAGARNEALVYVAEGMVAFWKVGAELKAYVGAIGAATVIGLKNGDATDGAKYACGIAEGYTLPYAGAAFK